MSDKCKPFNHLLKKGVKFEWIEECQEAFDQIKKYLLSPPVLIPPKPSKPFHLYISATNVAIGTMLAQKNDMNKEQAIYYISRTLVDYEICYVHIEKLCLAIVFATHKLRHYMMNHKTYVVARQDPLRYMMSHAYINFRTSKWIMLLTEYDLEFMS